MNANARYLLISAALLLMLAVILGAFGAHALRVSLSGEMLAVYKSAGDYHFIHALGLLVIGVLLQHHPESRMLIYSALSLILGIVLFCGSLYALSLTDLRILGAITPVGGLAFITGWFLLALAIVRI